MTAESSTSRLTDMLSFSRVPERARADFPYSALTRWFKEVGDRSAERYTWLACRVDDFIEQNLPFFIILRSGMI